ncbi:MAG: glycosyltransferase family 4 protein [Noviherbaspirillum sp.]
MSALKVGLSTTTLRQANVARGVDGIGIYTKHLHEALPDFGVTVRGRYFPGSRREPEFDIGDPFPRRFITQSLYSVCGARLAVADSVRLFHFTDHHVVRLDCPVVATLHDAVPLKYPEWTTSRFRAVKNFQLRRAARYADSIIAVSQAAVPDLVEYFGVAQDRISVVPCGVDSEWFSPLDGNEVAAALSAHGLRPGYFLFVGTLQPRKNVGRVIDAYLSLPVDVRASRQLVIVGRPGWHCEDEVARLNEARSRSTSVMWLSALPSRSALRRVFAGAGVFVFPSLYEGFGLPVLEAFAAGVPVVTSNVSSLPEVAGNAAAQVDPLSVEAIADAMRKLADDDARRRLYIERGRERARRLSWENTARLTTDVYRKLA